MELSRVGTVLDLFATQDATHFPSHFARFFIAVCQQEPCTIQAAADSLGISNSAASRTANALGAEHRTGRAGFGLITSERDPDEGRRYLLRLTPKGEALKRLLLDA